MNGTDDARLGGAITALTRVGVLLFAGWALWLFQAMYRASQTAGTRFTSAFDERLEVLAFLTFPPNLSLLALAAAAAATATWLAGPTQSLGLAILLRTVRWSSNAVAATAAVAVISEILREPFGTDTIETVAFRSGGMIAACGLSYLCLAAGRTAPGG